MNALGSFVIELVSDAISTHPRKTRRVLCRGHQLCTDSFGAMRLGHVPTLNVADRNSRVTGIGMGTQTDFEEAKQIFSNCFRHEEYFKEEGLDDVIEWRAMYRETAKPGRERFQQIRKSFELVGRSG